MVDRKNEVVEGIRRGSYRQVRDNENLELIEGEARFEPDGAVRVGSRVIRAPKIIVNVGARPAIPEIAGLDRTPCPYGAYPSPQPSDYVAPTARCH